MSVCVRMSLCLCARVTVSVRAWVCAPGACVCTRVPLCVYASARPCLSVGLGACARACTVAGRGRPCVAVAVSLCGGDVPVCGRGCVSAVTPCLSVRAPAPPLPSPPARRALSTVLKPRAGPRRRRSPAARPPLARRCPPLPAPLPPRRPRGARIAFPELRRSPRAPRPASSPRGAGRCPANGVPASAACLCWSCQPASLAEDGIGAPAIRHGCLHSARKMSARGGRAQLERAREVPGGPEGKGPSLPGNAKLHLQE